MKRETLKALEASIAKWEASATATNIDDVLDGAGSCPLCKLFFYDKECVGCPVYEATEKWACKRTPYGKAHKTFVSVLRNQKPISDFRKAAKAEVKFLKSLLPKPKKAKP